MDYLKAFLVGGAICMLGQLLIDKTRLTPARILVCYVVLGVILGGAGVYDKLVDFAGAGATVPLTGFGNTLAKGVREAVKDAGLELASLRALTVGGGVALLREGCGLGGSGLLGGGGLGLGGFGLGRHEGAP